MWLEKKKGRSLEATVEGKQAKDYNIEVYTSDIPGAGTDANVYALSHIFRPSSWADVDLVEPSHVSSRSGCKI